MSCGGTVSFQATWCVCVVSRVDDTVPTRWGWGEARWVGLNGGWWGGLNGGGWVGLIGESGRTGYIEVQKAVA